MYAAHLYDAVLLYATALGAVLRENNLTEPAKIVEAAKNGTYLFQHIIRDRKYESKSFITPLCLFSVGFLCVILLFVFLSPEHFAKIVCNSFSVALTRRNGSFNQHRRQWRLWGQLHSIGRQIQQCLSSYHHQQNGTQHILLPLRDGACRPIRLHQLDHAGRVYSTAMTVSSVKK